MVRTLALALLLVGCASSQGVESDAGDGPRRGGAEVSGQPDGAAAPEALPADGAQVPPEPLALPRCAPAVAVPCSVRHVPRNAASGAPVCQGRAIGRYLCTVCEARCADGARAPLVELPCRADLTHSVSCAPEMVCVQRCEDCPLVAAPAVYPWCAPPL